MQKNDKNKEHVGETQLQICVEEKKFDWGRTKLSFDISIDLSEAPSVRQKLDKNSQLFLIISVLEEKANKEKSD